MTMVRTWIDGLPVDRGASLDLLDHTIMRGDGCFEAIRSYGGRPFAVGEHLDRLAHSAAALRIDLPARPLLEQWVAEAALVGGDGVIRLIATRGNPSDERVRPRILLYAEPLPELPIGLSVATVPAPWHSAGEPWALAGVKTVSYAPNMAASREARERGFDDALLLAKDGTVLEGPTFSIAWVTAGTLETPSLELLILDSITRRHVLAVARSLQLDVAQGTFPLERLQAADEVFAMSTVKEVMPVTRVDGRTIEAGPTTARLAAGFRERTRQAG